ncbi:hypothetical protein ABNX05_23565 [Lysinibacillus sp. M3]|uniref:Uncharacterized protein n=1 Tax=Lysinibacillus zambalensis TaxID=3160866 RepID=A0ABV1MYP8_9BACI
MYAYISLKAKRAPMLLGFFMLKEKESKKDKGLVSSAIWMAESTVSEKVLLIHHKGWNKTYAIV